MRQRLICRIFLALLPASLVGCSGGDLPSAPPPNLPAPASGELSPADEAPKKTGKRGETVEGPTPAEF